MSWGVRLVVVFRSAMRSHSVFCSLFIGGSPRRFVHLVNNSIIKHMDGFQEKNEDSVAFKNKQQSDYVTQ